MTELKILSIQLITIGIVYVSIRLPLYVYRKIKLIFKNQKEKKDGKLFVHY